MKCKNCGKETLNRVYCSNKCRGLAISKGISKNNRTGTGKITNHNLARKYYKYKSWDKMKWYESIEWLSVYEFIEVMEKWRCYYCWENWYKGNLWIDRRDNKKWHTLENTVICCAKCNMTRWDRRTVEEMKIIGKVVKGFKE
jgi:hypothetical protein